MCFYPSRSLLHVFLLLLLLLSLTLFSVYNFSGHVILSCAIFFVFMHALCNCYLAIAVCASLWADLLHMYVWGNWWWSHLIVVFWDCDDEPLWEYSCCCEILKPAVQEDTLIICSHLLHHHFSASSQFEETIMFFVGPTLKLTAFFYTCSLTSYSPAGLFKLFSTSSSWIVPRSCMMILSVSMPWYFATKYSTRMLTRLKCYYYQQSQCTRAICYGQTRKIEEATIFSLRNVKQLIDRTP